jgi:hypothetical protein
MSFPPLFPGIDVNVSGKRLHLAGVSSMNGRHTYALNDIYEGEGDLEINHEALVWLVKRGEASVEAAGWIRRDY